MDELQKISAEIINKILCGLMWVKMVNSGVRDLNI